VKEHEISRQHKAVAVNVNYMKTLYTLTILFFCVTSFAQNETVITKIRNTVEQTNKDTGYTTKVLKNEQFLEHMTDGGGQLTGYFKKGQLVKIVEWIGLSSCINIIEYYFQGSKLIFAYAQGKEFQYVDSIGTFNSNKQSVTMECRFYFDHGEMAKSILKGATRCGGEPQNSWAKNYQSDCLRYINLLRKK
jgi:hypothetical protein